MSAARDYPAELELRQLDGGRWLFSIRGGLASVIGESQDPECMKVLADAYAGWRREKAGEPA